MKKLLPFVILFCLCSCKNTWNEDDKDSWKEACMENATRWAGSEAKAKTYCECVLQKMILKYPNENDALEHLDQLMTDSSLLGCKKEVVGN